MRPHSLLIFLSTGLSSLTALTANEKEQKPAHPAYESFETTLAANWKSTGSTALTLTGERYKSGKQSLCWEWMQWNWNGQRPSLTFHDSSAFKLKGKDMGFAIWVYNEKAGKTPMYAELLSKGSVAATCWFWMDYSGWAPLGASYSSLGLKGNAEIDSIRLIAPEGMESGRLFIDVAKFDIPNISHHGHLGSYQSPWAGKASRLEKPISQLVHSVNDPTLNRPWLPEFKTSEQINEQERAGMQKISDRILPRINRPHKGINKELLEEIREEFSEYQISRKDGRITGRPIDSDSILKPDDAIDFWKWYNFCDKVEKAYSKAKEPAQQQELKQMFIDLCTHLLDQGWQEGSRLRYSTNYPSTRSNCFLKMRDILEEAGLARDMALFLTWSKACQSEGGYLRETPYASMDGAGFWYNELIQYILMLPDEAERLQRLRIAQRFYSLSIINRHTIAPDGCCYHHGAFHFAYASYNLPRLVRTLQALADTDFRLGKEAHERLKTYAHAISFTFSDGVQPYNIAARAGTPVHGNMARFAMELAKLGTPDGSQEIDPEMASLAYSQILDKGEAGKAELEKEPLKTWIAEGSKPTDLTGHINLNGSPIAIHRRPGWMVGIAGMSSNWRGLEIYGWTEKNNYGIFARNGSICVVSNGNPPNLADSGWNYDGWNWAHFPGTTALQLTERQLFQGYTMAGNGSQVVGGTNMNDDGIWGFDYTGGNGVSFKKSTFCFGNRLTVITTDIQSKRKNENTVTTLFQNHLQPGHESILLDEGRRMELPSAQEISSSESRWMIDNQGNGYLIPSGQPNLRVQCQQQEWLYMIKKYLKDPEKNPIQKQDYRYWNRRKNSDAEYMAKLESHYNPSKGNFALAYFDHGKNAKDAACTYSIVVQTDAEEMKALAASPSYEIFQQDNKAHILRDKPSSTTGYILYTPNEKLNSGSLISSNNLPCFAMIEDAQEDKLTLSIVCPDIKRTEPLVISLRGKWNTDSEQGDAIKAIQAGDTTTLTLQPDYYMPLKFTLTNK